MGFKGADGTFGDVAAVDIGGNELVCGLPDVSDVATVLLAGFVVEDLVVNDVAALPEAGHDAGVFGPALSTRGNLARARARGAGSPQTVEQCYLPF